MAGEVNLVGSYVRSCALSFIACLAISAVSQQLPTAPQPQQNSQQNAPARPKRVGDQACVPCHEAHSTSYLHTSHHLTSQLPSGNAVLGSFSGSTLKILDPIPSKSSPGLSFRMEVNEGGYYETAIVGTPGHEQLHSERIDVVTGSGTRGQSYLYWLGDQLFELPVSYWADGHQWINSPGYKDKTANFSRAIYPRCLECHATSIVPTSADPLTNHYDRASLVTGVSCETCHGGGADHIAAHAATPAKASSTADTTILNPARFARDRQVDLCALCHSGGKRVELAPAFSYLPGQPLDRYLQPAPVDPATLPDVHGNQVGLLERSRCYLSSPTMSCSTCHDVHSPERPAAAYSDRCLSCHRVQSCKMSQTIGPKIADNCIDCHMPRQPTNAIIVKTAGNVVRTTMRNHWIRIYPEVAQP